VKGKITRENNSPHMFVGINKNISSFYKCLMSAEFFSTDSRLTSVLFFYIVDSL